MEAKIPNPADYVMKRNKLPAAGDPAKYAVIDHTDDIAVRRKCREELVDMLCNPCLQVNTKLSVIKELSDRLDGKPAQAVTLDANIRSVTVNANVQFVHAPVEGLILEHVDNVQSIEK